MRGPPIIDIEPLVSRGVGRDAIATEIGNACREFGFFYILGHGVDGKLQDRLERASRQFFALELDRKLAISMERGGRAWRSLTARSTARPAGTTPCLPIWPTLPAARYCATGRRIRVGRSMRSGTTTCRAPGPRPASGGCCS